MNAVFASAKNLSNGLRWLCWSSRVHLPVLLLAAVLRLHRAAAGAVAVAVAAVQGVAGKRITI